MSGHSKWATIKHKKGAADAKRGKVFSKLSKELTVVAKAGGGDPGMNAALRTVIQKAKGVNMPADNIERAIKKGTGELDGVSYEEVTYEGFGSGGVGIIVKVLTDNKNRSAAEIRHIFTKHNTTFAAVGAVSRGFERKGQILIDAESIEEDKLMEVVLEAGADDLTNEDGLYEVLTSPAAFTGVMDALAKNNIKADESGVSLIPMNWVPVNDVAIANSVSRFVSDLEENDDVQNVYNNMDVAENVLSQMET